METVIRPLYGKTPQDLARLEAKLALTRQKCQQNEIDKGALQLEVDKLTKTATLLGAEWNDERAQINDRHAGELKARDLEFSELLRGCREIENISALSSFSTETASPGWRRNDDQDRQRVVYLDDAPARREGKQNGNFRHGGRTNEAVAASRYINELARLLRDIK